MNQEIETTNQDAELMPISAPSNDTLDDLKRQVEAMQAARQVAEAMCNTKMVPKAYQGQPDDGAAAILYGAELGLGAIQSLQQVMVINGKPGVEARTMVALLRSHGFQFDVQEDTNEAVTVVGTAPSGETHTSRWTLEDAQTAGYTSNSLYKKIPRTMLYAKAATEVCRRLGSHILSGIAYSVEELQLHEPAVKATATRQPTGGVAALKARAKEPQQEPRQEIEQAPVDNQPDLAAELLNQIGKQESEEGLGKVMADAADLLETGDIDQATYNTIRDTGRNKWQELQA